MNMSQPKNILEALDPTNLTTKVYESILEAITRNRLRPGDEIPETYIAQQLNISPTPVREALNRLAGEGLVHKEKNKRPRIASFTRKEIEDLYDLRAEMEAFAVRLAISRASPGRIEDLRKLQAENEASYMAEDLVIYKRTDIAFHSTVLEMSDNTFLIWTMDKLRKRIQFTNSGTVLTGRFSKPSKAGKSRMPPPSSESIYSWPNVITSNTRY